jgi:two-component system, cell cycle response regulator
MTQPHRIVLVGFSAFEKVTFESFFRLAARRPPGYLLVADGEQAHLAVVNADDPATLRQCIADKPAENILLIGSQDGGTGWMLQRRPLNLMKVLATVESLLAPPSMATVPAALMPMQAPSPPPVVRPQARPPVMPPVAAPAASQWRPAAPPPMPAGYSHPTPAPAISPRAAPADAVDSTMRRSVRTGVGGLSSFDAIQSADSLTGLSAAKPQPADTNSQVDNILVVDDSDIALKFMRNRLARFGFHTDLVSSGEEALGKMPSKPYKFVFLDVMMEGLDGYQTCRAIKQRKYSDGKPPVVVMLTSRGGTIDKIRGTLAGCDAYLTKPLNERDLIAVLAKHDRGVARGFQDTNLGNSVGSGFTRSVK